MHESEPGQAGPTQGLTARRKVTAVGVVLVLVYALLFASGALFQFHVYSNQTALRSQAVNFRGPYPAFAGRFSNATLQAPDGRVLFYYMFRLWWSPLPNNYTGVIHFEGLAPMCPKPWLALHSLDFEYNFDSSGPGPTDIALAPGDFLPGYGSVQLSSFDLPSDFRLSYTDLQRGFPGQCGGLAVQFDSTIFPGSLNGSYPYRFNINVNAVLYSMNSSATPFVGETYAGSTTFSLRVDGNGTVTLVSPL